jgi:hypothetical protein
MLQNTIVILLLAIIAWYYFTKYTELHVDYNVLYKKHLETVYTLQQLQSTHAEPEEHFTQPSMPTSSLATPEVLSSLFQPSPSEADAGRNEEEQQHSDEEPANETQPKTEIPEMNFVSQPPSPYVKYLLKEDTMPKKMYLTA